jgi:hypothetical protein
LQDFVKRAEGRVREVLRHFDTSQPLVGAEIGVFAGSMSYFFVTIAPRLQLYMIDSWRSDSVVGTTAGQAFEWALANTSSAPDRVFIMKMSSLAASCVIAPNSLDFAFIDADHCYPAVEADIKAWKTKIKPGGWLCGDDYGNCPGVDRAVDEYVKATGLKLELGRDHTWFIQQ